MATGRCGRTGSRGDLIPLTLLFLYLLNLLGLTHQDNSEWLKKGTASARRINLRNLDIKDAKSTNIFTEDGYIMDNRQDPVSPKMLGGIVIQHEAQKLSARLRWLSNEEIGITTMQAIYDSLPYKDRASNEKSQLNKIVERLQDEFHDYLRVLNTNKVTVEYLYKFYVKQPRNFQHLALWTNKNLDCCSLPFSELGAETQYGCKISRRTSCDLLPNAGEFLDLGIFNPGRNLTEVWSSNTQYFPSLKWQYFISTEGVHSEYPANRFQWSDNCQQSHDTRHRNVYMSTIQPKRKHIVIMMDHGNSLSANQLKTAKGIAKHLLRSLSENDRVGVIGLASKPSFPREDSCLPHTLVPVTFEARLYFSSFFDNLEKEDAATNHSLGFKKAFDMIESTILTGRPAAIADKAMIIYISRGLLSSLREAKHVMETIAAHNGQIGHRVVINTYAVIEDGRPVMYEKSFLKDIAHQNFSKYDVRYRSKEPILKGVMMPIKSTSNLSQTVGKFYVPLNMSTPNDAAFSLPYLDEADRVLTMSLSQPCFYNDRLIGVAGLDLHMEDIVQDITYFNEDQHSYAFIINTNGYTVMHPAFNRPLKTRHQPMHTDIWHFENVMGFEEVRINMLKKEEGEQIMMIKQRVGNVTNGESSQKFYAKYIWKKVKNAPYVVAIKIMQKEEKIRNIDIIHVSSLPRLVYHRIDLLPTEKMCLHLKQLATLDISTVFLSANSFVEPFDHLSLDETKRMVQSYTAYLKDDTHLITNPGFKEKVKNDVAATARITDEWLRRFHTSPLNDYIIRRYVCTPSGVFRVFPGTLIDKTYVPTKRIWYKRAMEFPGHVTVSAPYLDVGGAGYIATISHTIFEGKPAALHNPADKVVAVMGVDITLGYFYKVLAETIPACEQSTVKCFLMDDRGYLIAHPSLIEPNGRGPVEQQHITHKEPLVANDILNHRHFVQKKLCNRYNDRTVQRFYYFNTTLDGVLTNLVHGEHCARYQITHIPGTNIFLGIVNHTCDTATAFCPCSMIDRLCLNCRRMEQIECECPCECPLEMDFCTGELLKEEDLNPSCPGYPEHEKLVQIDPLLASKLEQCYTSRCDTKKTKMECLGVLDCDWCQLEEDATTTLREPYCASQRVCFGGVLGAHTPYGDQIRVMAQDSDPVTVKSTPVGPVAGGIMGCFLVLALGVYCYRHHIHRNSHQYITTMPENQNRISQFYEPDDQEPMEDSGAGHTNFVLATFDNPATVSPYRVNTSYRRPAGGDSDHGYSTMTPHEDSEQASLPGLEPLLIRKDRYKPTAHSFVKAPILPPPPTNSRRSRSPTPPQTRLSNYQPIPEQTVIPSQTILPTTIPEFSHNIIANVQVHMVDTH